MSDASMARCEKCKRVAYDCHVIAMNASRAAASSQEVRSGPAVSSASIAIARRKTKPVRHIPMSVFGERARGCRRVPLEATDRYWQLCADARPFEQIDERTLARPVTEAVRECGGR
jgi:hypothetical protein